MPILNAFGVFTEDLHPTDRTQMDDRYGTLRAPVMLVGGLAATADSFEVLTGMALGLQKKGLQPLVISRQPLGKLFRFHSLNHIFNSRDESEADRILGLNTFLQDLERRYLPDLILMGSTRPSDAIQQHRAQWLWHPDLYALSGCAARLPAMLCALRLGRWQFPGNAQR